LLLLATVALLGCGSGTISPPGTIDECAPASNAGACQPCCDVGEVCWDFRHYDQLCAGTVCSIPCNTDDECVTYARKKGSSFGDRARCGDDHICDVHRTGLGQFVCA